MTKQLRSIVVLTVCSLVGVLALQVYFGYQIYQKHALNLNRDTKRALKEAIATADLARVQSINKLFKHDISDPDLVSITLNQEEAEPRIFVADAQTGDIHVSIRFLGEVDTSRIKDQLISELVRYNRNLLQENSVMYWTEVIGARLARYVDSIEVDKAVLLKEIRAELDTMDIQSSFELILSQDTSSQHVGFAPSFSTRDNPITVEGFNVINVELHKIGWEVLRRSGVVYLSMVLIFLLIVISFLVLLKFVRRQKRLSQLKDDFIDNVSHELLTPVTTLKLALDTLDRRESTPNKYVKVSQQQASRIAEVVDHILQVAVLDEQHAGLNIEPCNAEDLLTEVMDYYTITTEKPIRFSTTLPDNCTIAADPKHLLSVLHNLISNAIKYSGLNEVKIDFTGIRHKTCLKLSISDNGPGIPTRDKEAIFDKFHRVSTGNTHEVKGLGIGLYYARNILEQMGGSLVLTRSSSAGATFTLTIPLVKTETHG